MPTITVFHKWNAISHSNIFASYDYIDTSSGSRLGYDIITNRSSNETVLVLMTPDAGTQPGIAIELGITRPGHQVMQYHRAVPNN